MKVQSIVVKNVISVRIILQLIIHLSVSLMFKLYSGRGSLYCNYYNVVYIVFCKNCRDQYVSSATDFKARFRIYKSDIKDEKNRYGTVRNRISHPSGRTCNQQSKYIYSIFTFTSPNNANYSLILHKHVELICFFYVSCSLPIKIGCNMVIFTDIF